MDKSVPHINIGARAVYVCWPETNENEEKNVK